MSYIENIRNLRITENQYKCEVCKDIGYQLINGNATECTCRFPIYQKSLPERHRLADFDKLDYSNLDKVAGLKEMIDYFKRTPLNKVRKGVYLQGDVGRGKTMLACAIFNNYLGQGTLKFIVVDELIRRIKDAFNGGVEFDISRYMEADLLILDDLGAEKTTEFVEGEIYNVINYRYNKKLPTIITSNINWNDLPSKYEMNGKRLASRISEMCGSFNLNGKDYRRK